MKNALRTSLAPATLSLVLATAALAAPEREPGYVDIGALLPSGKGRFVEVDLSPGVIKFASRLAKKQEPEAAELLANIRRVRVNVVALDDTNRAATLERIEGVRRQLEAEGWGRTVSVREKDGENVSVYVKQLDDDVIQGLVVTVIDKKGEAVFVNIVGNISADRLGELAEKLNIEPLRKAQLRISRNAVSR